MIVELTSTTQLLVFWAVAGYFLGAIPFGIVTARALGLGDLRQIGSGNIGATNVLRTGSKLGAAFTLIGDAGKAGAAVLLARALAADPKLLLLDEPMAGMNVEEKEDMSRFILDVNDEFGTTIVLIEHDMGVVMDLSDRVVVMDYGKKIGDGPPDEVRNNQAVIDAYLGVAHD